MPYYFEFNTWHHYYFGRKQHYYLAYDAALAASNWYINVYWLITGLRKMMLQFKQEHIYNTVESSMNLDDFIQHTVVENYFLDILGFIDYFVYLVPGSSLLWLVRIKWNNKKKDDLL